MPLGGPAGMIRRVHAHVGLGHVEDQPPVADIGERELELVAQERATARLPWTSKTSCGRRESCRAPKCGVGLGPRRKCAWARRPRHKSRIRVIDPPAAQDDVAVVQHHRLAGRDRRLRLDEFDGQLVLAGDRACAVAADGCSGSWPGTASRPASRRRGLRMLICRATRLSRSSSVLLADALRGCRCGSMSTT